MKAKFLEFHNLHLYVYKVCDDLLEVTRLALDKIINKILGGLILKHIQQLD